MMLYLNEFVNETKFKEGMHFCFNLMRSNPYFESMIQYNKDTLYQLFFYKLFPKLSGLTNALPEPLIVNEYPTFLTDSNWLLGQFQYYKLTVNIADDYEEYEGEIVFGVFKTDFGYSFILMNQLNDSDLEVEYFHFDHAYLLRKFHSCVVKINVKGELFFKTGMNHMVAVDEAGWCHHGNLNKINNPYTVVSSSIILTQVLTQVETHDSNST